MYLLDSIIVTCSDPALARSITIIYDVLMMIAIFVPILLVVMITISVISLVMNPDDKKMIPKIIKKVIAAILIFLLPTIVNLIMNLTNQAFSSNQGAYLFNVSSCWQKAREKAKEVGDASYLEGAVGEAGKSLFGDLSGLKKYIKKETSSQSLGDGGILIIAGHSYAPYCNQKSNECREESGMKYLEPDQTRILARLLKSELDGMNLKASIANEMLGGTDAKMNKSFYIELALRTSAFRQNEEKFKKFTHVIELHFNASGGGARGTLLMQGAAGISEIDKELKNAVVKYTGKSLGNIAQGLQNQRYFQNLGIPMTYIEVEFYDNPGAMDQYSKNKEKIAHELALVFQKHYGSSITR